MNTEVVSPGDALWKMITEEGLYIPRLIADTGMRPGELERFILGRIRVTPTLAQRLETGTGVPASRWLHLQNACDRTGTKME